MALTYSQMPTLGTDAPSFSLPAANPGTAGSDTVSLADYADAEALVIVFTCNHCPYAKHIEDALVQVARTYQPRGVAFVAISSNDPATYPTDDFAHMAQRAEAKGFPFPYLYDETHNVARAYGALCTPDFFVYDNDRTQVYRGRFDETRPGGDAAHGGDLMKALDQLLREGTVTGEQFPSMGCNIKWKSGNAPQ